MQYDPEICASCNRRSDDLLECPCRHAFYCSTMCQTRDWPRHRQICVANSSTTALGVCNCCGALSVSLKACRCGAVLYCDQHCQKEHWRSHQGTCEDWLTHVRNNNCSVRDAWVQTSLTAAMVPADDTMTRGRSQRPQSSGPSMPMTEAMARKIGAQRLERIEEGARADIHHDEMASASILGDMHLAIYRLRMTFLQDEERKGRLTLMAQYSEFSMRRDMKRKSIVM